MLQRACAQLSQPRAPQAPLGSSSSPSLTGWQRPLRGSGCSGLAAAARQRRRAAAAPLPPRAAAGPDASSSGSSVDEERRLGMFANILKPLRDFGIGRTSMTQGAVGLFVFSGIGAPGWQYEMRLVGAAPLRARCCMRAAEHCMQLLLAPLAVHGHRACS